MAAQCNKCKEKITFAKSMTRADSWIPLDLYPVAGKGSVRKRFLTENGDEVVYGEVLTGTNLHSAIANAELLYVKHRETCTANRPYNPRPAHVTLNLPAPPRRPRRRF